MNIHKNLENKFLVIKILFKKPILFLVMCITETANDSFYFFYEFLNSLHNILSWYIYSL